MNVKIPSGYAHLQDLQLHVRVHRVKGAARRSVGHDVSEGQVPETQAHASTSRPTLRTVVGRPQVARAAFEEGCCFEFKVGKKGRVGRKRNQNKVRKCSKKKKVREKKLKSKPFSFKRRRCTADIRKVGADAIQRGFASLPKRIGPSWDQHEHNCRHAGCQAY